MERYVLAVLVRNRFGVLARVASMFRRRGFNIDTLTVGATDNADYSRITCTFEGDDKIKNQIKSQLLKMPDVENVIELKRGGCVARELVLIKINNTPETRQDIMSVVDVFRAKVIDYAKDVMTIEITGESTKIDAFIDLVREFGIIETCRTGIVALERGRNNISQYEKED